MALSPKAVELIERKNFAQLATIMGDGWPQITPVWIDHEEGRYVLVNTAVGRIKERNVRKDPRVVIGLFDQENPYRRVSIKGRVVSKLTGEAAWEHIDKLSMKYSGVKFPRRNGEQRIILKIEPLKEY